MLVSLILFALSPYNCVWNFVYIFNKYKYTFNLFYKCVCFRLITYNPNRLPCQKYFFIIIIYYFSPKTSQFN